MVTYTATIEQSIAVYSKHFSIAGFFEWDFQLHGVIVVIANGTSMTQTFWKRDSIGVTFQQHRINALSIEFTQTTQYYYYYSRISFR